MIGDIDRELLLDMLEYAEKAVRILGSSNAAALERDETAFLAGSYAVQIVGEAANKVSNTGKAALPEQEWRGAIAMRHKLVHGYRARQAVVLVDTVREDFPPLIARLRAVLNEGAP